MIEFESESSRLARANRFHQLLDAAAAKLVHVRDPAALIEELFTLAADELELDAYFNYRLDADGALHLAAVHGLAEDLVREGQVLQLGQAVCGIVARDREACHVPDVQGSTDAQHAFIQRAGLTSYACRPLLAHGRLLGTLGFGRRSGEPFDAAELGLLSTFTHYVAAACERQRTETALRVSEDRLQAVLDNAMAAIFLLDAQQRPLFLNAAAEQLLGGGGRSLGDQTLYELTRPRRLDGALYPPEACPFTRAFHEDRRLHGEEIITRPDGSRTPVSFTCSPVRGQGAQIVGAVVEMSDISARRQQEAVGELLMREVDHRARNALTVVQSVVRLTRAPDIATYREIVLGRVNALARAQGSLSARNWAGGSAVETIRDELSMVAKPEQFLVEGEDMNLASRDVQPLSLIMHELATNAVKHGALSRATGSVEVRVTRTNDGLEIVWTERGGPSTGMPDHAGFGTRMLVQLAAQMEAKLSRTWSPGGLSLGLKLPATRDEPVWNP